MTRKIRLLATFEFDAQFDPTQLEPNLDGIPGDVLPTDQAMELLLIRLDQELKGLGPRRIELDVAGPMYNASDLPS